MSTTATTHPRRAPHTATTLGSDAVLRCLEAEGVTTVFGMPGGAILPLYDAIARGTTIRHVLARHEQGAGHMAQGYARAGGGVGVVFATSGPGATNLVTPIADAGMDSTPLVCITGQVRSSLLGTNAFQECDITSVTAPLVKGSWLVRDVADLPAVLHEAFALARSGRPGPVLVDIPRDVQEAPFAPAQDGPGPVAPDRPDRTLTADPDGLARAAAAIDGARRPVLYVGGGAQGASPEVLALAERAGLPVVTTLMGKGAFPESHELFFGWPGMHGAKWANWAMHRADLVIAAGARFDDRVTGRLDAFAQEAAVIHIDVDRREHGKIRHADIAVHGELGPVCAELAARVAGDDGAREPWRAQLRAWRGQFPLRYDTAAGGPLKPQRALEVLAAATAGRDTVFTTGVGQHQMWAMQYLPCDRPRRFVTSGGHGTMGFGLPAAIGARAACPDAAVVCVDGDGSFQMTTQELATAVGSGLPVVVVILNNGRLGMVSQWQSMFYEGRASEVDLLPGMPDFATIARGYGALGFTVEDEDGLRAALAEALASGRPAVLDVLVEPEEHCYPMIVPGGAAADMVEWPGVA
ncbi:biosynthetic-type acetolactate synthase large subunit [Baekduia soli]|uniref:Acetolactate synthase n=1 Tax=Baekduia soli TaxID=496014 RepID=A0A5B8U9N6_9ACTN|nr:biosynthetic-type acetolactate synthase large subunit [Baekduia soli]QEC49707.1 biosynthetic-type acetolactate synthase large subunit [Baekduia soli]